MLTEKEFLVNKERYVSDVVDILNRRAEDEARLIFKRRREGGGSQLWTEVSAEISREINAHYARLFDFFQQRPELCSKPLYQAAILRHLPKIISETPRFRKRIAELPAKIKYAILASEIASSLVYVGDKEAAYEQMLQGHLRQLASS